MKKITKQQIIDWALTRGWELDRWGHLQKQYDAPGEANKQYRFRLSSTSVRYEVKVQVGDHNEWMRLKSGYYKDLSFTSDGKLSGLKL